MTETKLKNLTLFLLETLIIQKTNNLTEWLAYAFNEFVYQYCTIDKEIFEPIYNLEILDEFVKGEYELLSLNQIFQLMKRYHGFDGYAKLVETTPKETDKKLNDLALLFIEFQKELYTIHYKEEQLYYPKGYSKILQ